MLVKIRYILQYVFLFFLTALILDAGNPIFDRPARDGGFFLYAGSQILHGKIPYLDFWDSKGPAIFYVNALGLFFGQGSRWGVWILEFVFIFVSICILYNAVLKKWGQAAALLGIFLGAYGLRIVLGLGNYTEEYPLLFNSIALVLFWMTVTSEVPNRPWIYFLIGVMFGLSFTFRANNIGGLVAIGLSVLALDVLNRKYLETLQKIGLIVVGFIVPTLLWVVYFQILGAAWDMLYASIIFNFSYASAKSKALLDYFGGFGRYGMTWVAWVVAFGYFIVVYKTFRKIFQRQPVLYFDIFLLLWFPVEVLLSNLSGRNFSHYYISWMPAISIYGAVIYVDLISNFISSGIVQKFDDKVVSGILALLILIFLALSLSSVKRYGDTFGRLFLNRTLGPEFSDPLAVYIQNNTQKDDLVLTWYPELGVNFTAQRTSPVKLVYYPLFLDGSLPPGGEESYLKDLFLNRPQMIVDCSLSVNAIPSLDEQARKEQFSKPGVKKKMYIYPGMDQVFSFVSENYHKETSIDKCFIFRLNKE
jgi:hypothetical protein